jgi:serine/threonine-protein kinase
MTRERWERLAPLVDAILDQPADRRLEYIAQISGGDAALVEELARFVRAYGEQENETSNASIFAAANDERSALISERLRDAASDLLAQLRASLGATYVIEREIGGGGMARVFVAEETGLGRKVVIKVLPPEMAEEISAERFAREIKLAASLQQANIVPVLAAGTAAGFPYYTMPFVEGLSLRERLLREGAPPVNEAISILRDVARALAFAHSRGVIHRDIKPGNILLSDRTAVVTDFGIAKALGAAREGRAGAPQDSLSHTGTLGTPAYMAPEQASSDPNLDHRADIYSFGCVAFELLTGKPPFDGAAPHDVIAAHLHETPWREIELPSEIPVAVAQLVATCLEKATSCRPQSADEVLRALDGAANQPIALPPRRSRRMTFAISTVILVTGIAVAYPAFRASEPLTLAAVPFRDLTRDTAIGHWSDGISDEILDRMAKVKGLRIVGRAAAFRYRNFLRLSDPSDQAFERELGARLFLTGTLSEAEGRVIVSVQLSDSKSRGEIWSESFSGGSRELGSITDEIVRRVTDALRARFGKRIGRGATTPDTRNGAVLDQHMIGKEELRRRGFGVEQAIENIESVVRAIDLDSNFAGAHAALAAALDLRVFVLEGPPDRLIARAVTEAHRALALDNTRTDAYLARVAAHAVAGEWEASDSLCRHAIELEADNAEVLRYFGLILILRGDATRESSSWSVPGGSS